MGKKPWRVAMMRPDPSKCRNGHCTLARDHEGKHKDRNGLEWEQAR